MNVLHYYRLTPLEQSVEDTYLRLGVTEPEHLTITNVASKLNIWVHELDMPSLVVESRGMYSMNIDRRLTPERQWEDFLHELCHVLRHAGNQTTMPEPMLRMQETDADRFQLYAAIPYFMLRRLELPERRSEIVELLRSEFRVTPELAQRRLEQMHRRVLQGVLDEESMRQSLTAASTRSSANWSDETKRLMYKLYLQLERRKYQRGNRKRPM
ncbi:ImmA/IrrE family metallo-endopeptidase [Paenibacillus cymbidii]|uniref:ImmA/IrrE family metallo-endopeptidase n=1 Tax=Paenibacillus cymbidii TaxID=1639034 RepID=UPI0010822579|nr:ImmA/IrrE family metallo-endopeptidase [Paenibacillus cymbidii]